MKDVLIHSPFPRQDSQGNSTTADRLEKILRSGGLSVALEEEWYNGCEAGCLVALNARRSAGAVEEFRDACPEGKVVIVLTGTDINHPEMAHADSVTRQTMQAADRLVILHEGSLVKVPADLQERCDIIYPSVDLPAGLQHQPNDGDGFEVIMAGNVRAEKNLPTAMDACALLPEDSPISVQVYGDGEGALAQKMLAVTASSAPFLWKGKAEHAVLIDKMAHADLLLNSSTQEGGANAICEAICLGLPVVASRIPGNVGMLGEDYKGYFTSNDAESLAEVLLRCATDGGFYQVLVDQVNDRALWFDYAEESRRWLQLVNKMLDVVR